MDYSFNKLQEVLSAIHEQINAKKSQLIIQECAKKGLIEKSISKILSPGWEHYFAGIEISEEAFIISISVIQYEQSLSIERPALPKIFIQYQGHFYPSFLFPNS